MDENDSLTIRRYYFGIIFQTHYLFKGFSALDNIELARVLSCRDLDDKTVKRFRTGTPRQQKL
ncbi:hypothetical protein, partial [Klebsiella pneumoniae]|uniref:hypothetical protein n=1 Tax=Klebsiella pneumoniae TaxID=573 RepID=UPI00325AEC4C